MANPKTDTNPKGAGRPKTNKMVIYLTGISDPTYSYLLVLRKNKQLNDTVKKLLDGF